MDTKITVGILLSTTIVGVALLFSNSSKELEPSRGSQNDEIKTPDTKSRDIAKADPEQQRAAFVKAHNDRLQLEQQKFARQANPRGELSNANTLEHKQNLSSLANQSGKQGKRSVPDTTQEIQKANRVRQFNAKYALPPRHPEVATESHRAQLVRHLNLIGDEKLLSAAAELGVFAGLTNHFAEVSKQQQRVAGSGNADQALLRAARARHFEERQRLIHEFIKKYNKTLGS